MPGGGVAVTITLPAGVTATVKLKGAQARVNSKLFLANIAAGKAAVILTRAGTYRIVVK